ncbi:MAG TPA: TonB-dependent siderophore receptor, partial [Cyanobacteria bacterium UBA11049]|nr:TonB-dependent siderophore receptor [Cyanobacteria bacterium UBA11049]
NSLITDIPNAQLRLPKGGAFQQENPTQDIASVEVTNLDAKTLRVTVRGKTGVPTAEVSQSPQALILSVVAPTAPVPQPTPAPIAPPVTPAPTPEAQIPPPAAPAPEAMEEAPLELEVTAELEAEGYRAPNATSATRTDTPLRDIPRSIQVVPQQVLKDQRAIQLEEALRNVSGVTSGAAFGGAGGAGEEFIIRGFTDSSIFRDGFQGDAEGSAFSSLRETANIERIEVLKGPASVLYGNLEPGGIINLVTKKPLEEPFYSGELSIGSFSLYRPSIDLSGPLTPDKSLLYRLNAVYEHSGSFRTPSTVDVDRFFAAPVLAWKIGDNTDLRVELEYLNDDRPFDEGLVAIGTEVADIPISRRLGEPGDFREFEDIAPGYVLEHRFSEDWTLRNAFRAELSNTSTRRFVPVALDETTGELEREVRTTEGNRESYDLQTQLTGRFATGSIDHQVLFGVDVARVFQAEVIRRAPGDPINIFDPDYGAPIPALEETDNFNIKLDTLGIFLQDQIALADNVKLLVSGRFDIADQSSTDNLAETTTTQNDTAFSPVVGVVYQPIEPISLYASYSRSFAPNTSVGFDGSLLEPTRGTQYEAGIRAELTAALAATLAAYEITKTNIATTPNNSAFSIAVGEQRSRGIEFDISGEISPGWNIIASYSYTNAEITESEDYPVGNKVPNVPHNKASLWTTYEFQNGGLEGLGLGLGLFYVDARQGDLENSFELPSYMRTDAAIYYKQNNWRAAINFQNLFGIRYFETSELGRTTVIPGAPLTVVGSFTVEF